MKRISKTAVIILGNGFDLAHQLPTSYNNFSIWCLSNYVVPEIFEITYNFRSFNIDKARFIDRQFIESFRDVLNGSLKNNTLLSLYNQIYLSRNSSTRNEEITNYMLKNDDVLRGMLINKFLNKLYLNSYENWFDIESAYFFELDRVLSLDPKTTKQVSFDSIDPKVELLKLNSEFDNIKKLLKEYLQTIDVTKNKDVTTFFNLNFSGKEDVFIVNFNYTDTVNQYLNEFKYSPTTKNNKSEVYNYFIHGDLNSDLIFGYGDDDSEEYKLMKKTGRDEYLENFKTFHYLENNNYRELIDVLDGLENYEAYILGHSLSLTDKTLLYEILSPEKCYNIHLFHRSDISEEVKKKREIKKLHFNISRILNNDNGSRKRIIPIKLSPHFPYKESDKSIIHRKIESIYESGTIDY